MIAGSLLGRDTVQLYVTFPRAADEPPRQLKGIVKTPVLLPNASTIVQFTVLAQALSVWDVAVHDWRSVHGEFEFHVGASSVDLRLSATLTLMCILHIQL